MTKILCLETSTDVCSVAVINEVGVMAYCETFESNKHTEVITLLIKDTLYKAGIKFSELDAVAVSIGPGSYTSLRIGLSTAKGICYALGIPIISINSLEVLAYGVESPECDDLIIPMIDARRMEVYSAVYNHKRETLSEPQAVILDESTYSEFWHDNKLIICGNGALKFITQYPKDYIQIVHQNASAKYMWAPTIKKMQNKDYDNIISLTPFYLKSPNITISKKIMF